MPYVFYEELPEGAQEADVRSADDYNALQLSLDTMTGYRDELQRSYDEVNGQLGTLSKELDDAKTKFANAFLSSPQKMKENQQKEMRQEEKPMTFEQLFNGRNQANAN